MSQAQAQLDYAPGAPIRRRKRIRRAVRVVVLVLVVGLSVATWRYHAVAWQQAKLLHRQHRCLTYAAPPDQIVSDGASLGPGVQIGLNTSNNRTEWLSNDVSSLIMQYPSGQAWGSVFFTFGPAVAPGAISTDVEAVGPFRRGGCESGHEWKERESQDREAFHSMPLGRRKRFSCRRYEQLGEAEES